MARAEGRVRLAEVIASLSLATDLGMGQPLEKALRSCLIASRLGRLTGCDDAAIKKLYYLALLQHIGCTSHAHEWAAYTGGDEIAMRTHAIVFANSPMGEFMSGFIRHAGRGLSPARRAGLVAAMMINGRKRFKHVASTQCEAAVCLAQRMHMPAGVLTGLAQGLETWNGKGGPRGARGDELAVTVRVLAVAADAEVFERLGGLDACRAAIQKRRGVAYDPVIADAFIQGMTEIFNDIPVESLWDAVLDAEPQPHTRITETNLDGLARAFGDFIDLKMSFTIGHSSGVARLAEDAAAAGGSTDEEVVAIRRAALLHDLGRIAVPNGIWEKAGALDTMEWERVRLHPYHSDRILSRAPVLRPLAAVASSHHERADGSGYHRGSSGTALSPSARLLAAADAYQAMTQPRPHRPAMPADQAARELRSEADAGKLDRHACELVLQAAGHARTRPRLAYPAGLSEREVDVLRLICLGQTNRQMAERLHIADKTVGHHIEHIYNKIGRSTRAGAALFAMEHDLVN